MRWRPMTETPPKDKPLFVEYDNDADPWMEEGSQRLTPYAAWADGGDYLPGRGYHVAHWGGGYSENDGGYEIIMPDWWFINRDFEIVLNPIRWMLLEEIIQAGDEGAKHVGSSV